MLFLSDVHQAISNHLQEADTEKLVNHLAK